MFIGHYGPALAAKRLAPKLSLGTMFVAAQLLDVLFGLFVLLGVEKMRIVPGFAQVNAYDLYDIPLTHSLVGALAWSVLAALAIFALRKRGVEAWALGAVVFSHFVLDVPVHTPDLPLTTEASAKLGLGLWQSWKATVALELVVLALGALVYTRAAPVEGKRETQRWLFFAVLVLLTIATPFLPTPQSPTVFALQALFGYGALALVAYRLEAPLSSLPVEP